MQVLQTKIFFFQLMMLRCCELGCLLTLKLSFTANTTRDILQSHKDNAEKKQASKNSLEHKTQTNWKPFPAPPVLFPYIYTFKTVPNAP